MTNFQFYLNSPLRGRFILGPADGFFPNPFSAFYLLFIGLQVRQIWLFQGQRVVVLPEAPRPCCPAPALDVSPSLRGLFFLC